MREKGRGVWFTEDLTKRQKEVQKWIEKEAEAWRKQGKEAREGYQKLWIDGTCLEWDEVRGELRLRQESKKNLRKETKAREQNFF